jgi:hypothetical protein
VSAIGTWIQTDERNPAVHRSSILPSAQVSSLLLPAGEQPVAGCKALPLYLTGDLLTGLFGNFELHGPTGLPLQDHDALSHA